MLQEDRNLRLIYQDVSLVKAEKGTLQMEDYITCHPSLIKWRQRAIRYGAGFANFEIAIKDCNQRRQGVASIDFLGVFPQHKFSQAQCKASAAMLGYLMGTRAAEQLTLPVGISTIISLQPLKIPGAFCLCGGAEHCRPKTCQNSQICSLVQYFKSYKYMSQKQICPGSYAGPSTQQNL